MSLRIQSPVRVESDSQPFARYFTHSTKCSLIIALLITACTASLVKSEEPLNIYTDAASFHNNNVFELAVEEWERFLQNYPQHELARKARYYLGVCYFQLKKHPQAISAFQSTITKEDKQEFELLEDAYLNLGSAQFAMGSEGAEEMYADASKTYAKLLEIFPRDQGELRDQALYFLGDALGAQGEHGPAAKSYAQLISEHPESKLRPDAIYALAASFDDLKQHEKAAKYYSLYLRDYPDGELSDGARMGKAETLVVAGKYDEASREFSQLAQKDGFAAADLALMRQAFCVWSLQKFDEAAQLYVRVTELPQSQYGQQATLMAGRGYYRAEQFKKAEKRFQEVVRQRTERGTEAAHWLCRIHLRSQRPNRALNLTDQMLPLAKQSPYYADLKLDRADALYEISDRRSESLDLYLQIFLKHDEHKVAPQALYNAAFTAMEMKRYKDGFAHATTFLERYPKHPLRPEAQHVAAECQLLLGDYPTAERTYRTAIEEYPEYAEQWLWRLRLGLALFLQKKYGETTAVLKSTLADIQESAQLADALFMMGVSRFHQEAYDQATAALMASLEADQRWEKADEVVLYLARSQRKLDQKDQALRSLARLLNDYPDSRLLDHAYYWYGEACYAKGQFDLAQEKYRTLVQNWPQSEFAPHAFSGWGWCCFRKKNYKGGSEAFGKLISSYPQHTLGPEAHYGRALCHHRLKDYQRAVADLDVYLKSDLPVARRTNAMYLRGLSLIEVSKYDIAIESFAELLRLNPGYASEDSVKYQLAWAHKLLNQRAQSAKWFAKLAEDHPGSTHSAEAHYHLGENLYWHDQNFAAALDQYYRCQQVVKESELGEKSLYMMAWCQYQLEQFDKAAQLFQTQVDQYPSGTHFPDAVFMHAESLFKLERYDEALSTYGHVRGQTGLSEERIVLALLHSGQAAGQLGNWDESLTYLREITENHPNSQLITEALFEQGVSIFSLGLAKEKAGQANPSELDESLKLFHAAATKARSSVGARARFHMGEVYFQKKMFVDAIRHYQRVIYGYGGENAPDKIKPWQARAGFQAGQASLILANKVNDEDKHQKLIEEGKKYFQFVVEKHPADELTATAEDKLKQL